MKKKTLLFAAISLCFIRVDLPHGQGASRLRLVFDQAHGEQPPPGQLDAIAKKLGLEIQTSPAPITDEALRSARILYLRAPSKEFTAAETEAVVAFVKGGGSLLLVLDEERRQSLEKTRVNNLITPFGMRLTPDTGDLHNNGAIAKAGEINKADREVPFDGGVLSRAAPRSPFSSTKKASLRNLSEPTSGLTTGAASSCSARAWRPCFWVTLPV